MLCALQLKRLLSTLTATLTITSESAPNEFELETSNSITAN